MCDVVDCLCVCMWYGGECVCVWYVVCSVCGLCWGCVCVVWD